MKKLQLNLFKGITSLKQIEIVETFLEFRDYVRYSDMIIQELNNEIEIFKWELQT